QFIFPDESVIRLTTARYYTPTGRLIQKSYSNGYSDYSKEVARRFKNGELLNKDSVHLPDTLKFYTLTKKRTVFGGGGIMPDIFVPIDTTDYSDYYRKLLSNNILSGFIIQFIDQNRNTLMDKYTDFKIFKNKFEADEALLKEIATYAQEKSVAFDSTGFNQCRNLMSCYVKATIARNLWGLNEFVEVINSINPSFNKAVEAIDNWDKYCPSN
ncbi:MAG TPA: peptidase S41, partial [Bacteroidales bacterium]